MYTYLPRSRSTSGFECLLDEEEKKQFEKEHFQSRISHVAAVILVLLLVTAIALDTRPKRAFGEATPQHEHILPTPLSVVDPVSGKYINSLENKLYKELKNVEMLEHRFLRTTTDSLPLLELDKTHMMRLRQPLTVSWTSGRSSIVDENDIIALYCPANSDHGSFQEAATLAQIAATSRKHGGTLNNEWLIPSFPITKYNDCQFRMFDRQDNSTLQLIATSPVLHIPGASRTPTAIHLALSEDPTEMVIQFNTAEQGSPIAMYGIITPSIKIEGKSHTYTAHDLCSEPANITETGKFQDPGMLHVIRLKDLRPNEKYFYKVGLASGQGVTWSNVFSFVSPPVVGYNEKPFSYVVYGDQGCPSLGWGDGALWTSAMTAREMPNIRAVHHFGDLSYAMGAAHIWDEWLHMIEPFSTSVPVMVGVGNHEYDHLTGGAGGKDPSGVMTDGGFMPEWGNFGMDSQGECGVPTSQRFIMPSSNNSNGVFWYSYDFATVHTIMLSSEHNMTAGSVQHEWFLHDLERVNRTLTPWVIVELHRPLYQSEFFWAQNSVGVGMRYEVEYLLKEFKVDLVLAGHYHSYLRTCDGLYQSKCNNGGPMHITVGSAGAHLDVAMLYPNHWTEVFISQEFGYGRITIVNASALHYEFIKAGASNDTSAGKVRDDVWLFRER